MISLSRRLEQLEEASAALEPQRAAALDQFLKEMGLPLPLGTPQRVIRKGARLLRQAAEMNFFDDFKKWVSEQHAIYGGKFDHQAEFKHSSGRVPKQ